MGRVLRDIRVGTYEEFLRSNVAYNGDLYKIQNADVYVAKDCDKVCIIASKNWVDYLNERSIAIPAPPFIMESSESESTFPVADTNELLNYIGV